MLFVAFWLLLVAIVREPREPFVSAFVVVAFAGMALAGLVASTRVPQTAPEDTPARVGFGYPVDFLFVTVRRHDVEATDEPEGRR